MQPLTYRGAMAPLTLVVAVLGGVLSACAWSVPADPGANARRAGSLHAPTPASLSSTAGPAWAPAAADPAAGALYASRCAQCHDLVHPATYSAAEWPAYVDRYGPRAGLFGQERSRVLTWLQAHGR